MEKQEQQRILREAQATLNFWLTLDSTSFSHTEHDLVAKNRNCLQHHLAALKALNPEKSVNDRFRHNQELEKLQDCLSEAKKLREQLKFSHPDHNQMESVVEVDDENKEQLKSSHPDHKQFISVPEDTLSKDGSSSPSPQPNPSTNRQSREPRTPSIEPEPVKQPSKIFYSYATTDRDLKQNLENHLSTFRLQGVITEWDKDRLIGGVDIQNEINKHWQEADIILLLLSANFLASTDEYLQMQEALKRFQKGTATLIPIYLSPANLPREILALKVLPDGDKSITEWKNRDRAWLNVVKGIGTVIDSLKSRHNTSLAAPSAPAIVSPPLLPQLVSNQSRPETTPTSTGGNQDLDVSLSSARQAPQLTATRIKSGQIPSSKRCDVLLVTAIQEETRSLLNAAQQITNSPPKPEFLGQGAYFDLHTIGGAHVFLVQSEMGAGEPGGATLTVQEGIQHLSPSAIILVGIAFGMQPKEQHLGDILVSQQLRGYELQRVGQDKTGQWSIILRSSRPQAATRLLAILRNSLLIDWTEPEVQVHIGLMLSGEKLIDNVDFREQLHRIEPEAIGGEMEGAGLYAAAARNNIDWIIIKGISDWADGKKRVKKKERQQKAAQNATKLVMHILQLGGLRNSSAT